MAKKPDSPSANEARINAIEEAWAANAPDATFGKMTLEQFKARVQPSRDAREKVGQLQSELEAALVERDTADGASLAACDDAVKGVVGDPDFGDDSALYGAMGYVRKSERKTGLTRKKTVAASPST